MAIGRLLRGETAARYPGWETAGVSRAWRAIPSGREVRHVGGCSRFDAKVVPIAVETDRKCGLNTPRAIVCDGRRFEIARVGATLPCPSMFGKADATVTGVLVDVGGRCVARGLICDDGLWFSVKPDG